MSSKGESKKKATLSSWDNITCIRRFKTLSSFLRKYGMRLHPTMYPDVWVTESEDVKKRGIVYPYGLVIGKVELKNRQEFWDFTSPEFQELLLEDTRSIPSRMLISNSLILSLHRDMCLETTLTRHPDYEYADGVISKILGEVRCPIARVQSDNTFTHIYLGDEHIVRTKQHLRNLTAPMGEFPFEFVILRELIISIFVSRDFNDLLMNKARGRIEEAFHPCYQIESCIGRFIYYALSPPVVEFKDPSITLVLPSYLTIDNIAEHMTKIPSPKVLARLLQGYVVGPMLMNMIEK